MSIKHILFSTLLSFSAFASEPLPNWLSPDEKVVVEKRAKVRGEVPPKSFRLVAEWEPTDTVVIGYMGYSTMLKQISGYATRAGSQVKVLAAEGPYTMPGTANEQYEALDCDLNTVWMRDYGPFGIIEDTGEVGIVDSVYRHWQYRKYDDRLPSCLGGRKGIKVFKMDLILDGGNLMVDTAGNLFMTKRTYLWNSDKSKAEVDATLKKYFNVTNIHAIDYAGYPNSPSDGTGHIDMIVKLLNNETVLIAESSSQPYGMILEKAVEYFKSIKTPAGNDYKILRVPAWAEGRTWYTYTNSLIVNNHVLMPSFRNAGAKEQKAIDAYKEGMEDVTIYPINSDDSIRAGGSIHCVTQTIPSVE